MPCPVSGLIEEICVDHLIKIEGKLRDHVLACPECQNEVNRLIPLVKRPNPWKEIIIDTLVGFAALAALGFLWGWRGALKDKLGRGERK